MSMSFVLEEAVYLTKPLSDVSDAICSGLATLGALGEVRALSEHVRNSPAEDQFRRALHWDEYVGDEFLRVGIVAVERKCPSLVSARGASPFANDERRVLSRH